MESPGLPVTALIAAVALGAPCWAAPLELAATIPMPGVKGRIDHFAVDVKGHRLFVAALGNNTVEVLDIAAKRHVRSIAGFGEPQGLFRPESRPLGDGETPKKTVRLEVAG